MPDLMKSKKSELRLYCDLLMQQVHSVKESISKSDGKDVEVFSQRNCICCDIILHDCNDIYENIYSSIQL